MRPQSRFNTIARVSFPKGAGQAALQQMRLDDSAINAEHDAFDEQAKRMNERAAERARLEGLRPPPRVNRTPKERFRSRTKLGAYFPEHKDNLDLHPFKPTGSWETSSEVALRNTMPPARSRSVVAPIGWTPLPRRATPPGAWVPGGFEALPRTQFHSMKRGADGRAQMLLPLGNQRPAEARTYVP